MPPRDFALGISSEILLTAALFDDATTISKPVSSGFSKAMDQEAELPSNSTRGFRLVWNASPAELRRARACARLVMFSAKISRSNVVFPVPGGPLTENSPPLDNAETLLFMANCFITLITGLGS